MLEASLVYMKGEKSLTEMAESAKVLNRYEVLLPR